MDMYHTIKRISEGCQETRHSVNKRNCVYSDVVRKPPRKKHSAKLMKKNETEILRNPNAQSKSLSALPCKHPVAAKHMLLLPTHIEDIY